MTGGVCSPGIFWVKPRAAWGKTPAVSARILPSRPLLSALAALCAACPAGAQTPNAQDGHTGSLGMKFVRVPGTTVHFAIHETTVAQWQAFVREGGHAWDYKPHFEQGPDHPAVGVTLQDARAFCGWLTEKEQKEGRLKSEQGYRLPTRAEWDAAAGLLRTRKPDLTLDDKLADDRAFPWGQEWPPPKGAGNLAEGEIPGYEDGFPFTAPVGQFKPTADGLHDLAGNVWEWCWDPEIRAEQHGVLRGGSWAYFYPESLRSAYLYTVPAALRMPTIGFRCVYEDKARTATLLAAMKADADKLRADRRQALTGAEVSQDEVAAMRKRFATGGEAANLPDPASLKPAAPGARHLNSLGMDLVPLGSSALIAAIETRAQDYEAFLKASGRAWTKKPTFLISSAHPAVSVSWDEAAAFCAWLTEKERAAGLIGPGASYRLPDDLEWSRAAGLEDETGADPAERGKSPSAHYPWSATGEFPPPPFSANLDAGRIPGYSDRHSYTAPVTNDPANSLGIHALGGNAAEWCLDAWPGAENERVIRGGSWLSFDKDQLRTGHRQHAARDSATAGTGFRVLLDFNRP